MGAGSSRWSCRNRASSSRERGSPQSQGLEISVAFLDGRAIDLSGAREGGYGAALSSFVGACSRAQDGQLSRRSRCVVVHDVVEVLPAVGIAVQRGDVLSADHAVAVEIDRVERRDAGVPGEGSREQAFVDARKIQVLVQVHSLECRRATVACLTSRPRWGGSAQSNKRCRESDDKYRERTLHPVLLPKLVDIRCLRCDIRGRLIAGYGAATVALQRVTVRRGKAGSGVSDPRTAGGLGGRRAGRARGCEAAGAAGRSSAVCE